MAATVIPRDLREEMRACALVGWFEVKGGGLYGCGGRGGSRDVKVTDGGRECLGDFEVESLVLGWMCLYVKVVIWIACWWVYSKYPFEAFANVHLNVMTGGVNPVMYLIIADH